MANLVAQYLQGLTPTVRAFILPPVADSTNKPRSVESTQYHVWTDALHGRALARQAANDWDRGTYVRWTIVSAWIAFEMACEEAMQTSRLGDRFKDRLDRAVKAVGLSPINWGRGLWQQVLEIHQLRVDYVHRQIPQSRLFAPVHEAERAVAVLRGAMEDIYVRFGKPVPQWVSDDSALGWAGGRGTVVHAQVTRAGAREDDPECIKIAYVYKGEEHISEVLPTGTDPQPILRRLLQEVVIPISAVRAYRGTTLIHEIPVRMRGS